jgi:hypothetical protein
MPSYRPENSWLARFASLSMTNRPRSRVACGAAFGLLALFAVACSPEIGDDCATALDCSASGTRLCDMTQRGGYCTLEGCEENTCPEEAVCVQFGRRFEGQSIERLARTFCMLKCDSRSDCRTDDGYSCFSAKTFGARDEAQILGKSTQKFCAQTPSTFVLPDGGVSSEPEEPVRDAGRVSVPEDGAMSMPEDDAGAVR